jgi:hypothetical protein
MGGRKILRAIDRDQITAVKKDKAFQAFSAVQLAKNIAVDRRECVRVDRVGNLSHLGVTGHRLDVKHPLQVLDFAGRLAALVKGE